VNGGEPLLAVAQKHASGLAAHFCYLLFNYMDTGEFSLPKNFASSLLESCSKK
jgi:hypothetical protein